MKMGDEDKPAPLKQEILDKIAALITAAFGLVAALAWNDAIKAVFKEIFGKADAVGPMLIYAIIVTIIAVILTIIVARAAAKAKSS
jgi:ABC-type multidrug transport system fused ATPase/permease subunit